MDFIMGFPRTIRKHDAIMVVVDNLRNTTQFIPIKCIFKAINVVDIFMKDIFRLHGLPKTIISDRDENFTSNFLKGLFTGLGTQLAFSLAYHPQTYF